MWNARVDEWVLGPVDDIQESAAPRPEARSRPQRSASGVADAESTRRTWPSGVGSSSCTTPDLADGAEVVHEPDADDWDADAQEAHEVEGGHALSRLPHSDVAATKVGIDDGDVVLIHQACSRGPPQLVPYCKHVLQMLASVIGGASIHFITTVGRAYTYQQTLTSLTDVGILDILAPPRNVHPTDGDAEKAHMAASLGATLMVDDRATLLRERASVGVSGLLFSRTGDAMWRWQNFRSLHDLVRQVDN